jgi:hypothetical protein
MYIIIVVACYLENSSGRQWPNTIDEIENEKKVTSKLYSFALWFSGLFNMASTPMSCRETTLIQYNTISVAIIDSSNKDISRSLLIQSYDENP